MTKRLRQQAKRVARQADEWGRQLGVLPYRLEQRTSAEWSTAYGSGALEYYGRLDELGRYSAIVGYVKWTRSGTAETRPSVLDVGCGVGLLRRQLADVPMSDYLGVDLSDTAIEAARSQRFSGSRFVVGDFMSTELGQFDVVVVNEVLYFAADPSAFLERVRSLLRGGGVVIISMWRHPGDRRLWKIVDRTLHLIDRVEVRNRRNPVNTRGWIVSCYRA